jgi:hypothetical protein
MSIVLMPATTLRMEEHRREQVNEHGGRARPDAEDVGALMRGGRQTRAAVVCGTAVATRGMAATTHGTLAEWCLVANK